MKKFVLAATVLALAGFSAVQASEVNTIKNTAIVRKWTLNFLTGSDSNFSFIFLNMYRKYLAIAN